MSVEGGSAGRRILRLRQQCLELRVLPAPVLVLRVKRLRDAAPTHIAGEGFLLLERSGTVFRFQRPKGTDGRDIPAIPRLCPAHAQIVIRDAEILRGRKGSLGISLHEPRKALPAFGADEGIGQGRIAEPDGKGSDLLDHEGLSVLQTDRVAHGIRERGFTGPIRSLLRESGCLLRISHDLLNKRVAFRPLRVRHLSAYDAASFQRLADGGGVDGIFSGLDLFRLDSVILCLLLLSQIKALPDQPGDSSGDFFPGKMHLRATPFLIPHPLSAMRFVASIRIGQRVRTSARTVLLLEKIHLFLVGVGLLKKGKDASLAAGHEAAFRQICVDFIFGDELPDRRDFRHFRRKAPAGKVKVIKGFQHFIQPVKVKPKQIAALLLIRQKLPVLAIKPCAKRRVRQLFSKPFCLPRKIVSPVFGEAGQIPGVYGFSAEILPQVPQLFGKPEAFISFGPGQLHIGGEPSLLQKLSDAACGFLP